MGLGFPTQGRRSWTRACAPSVSQSRPSARAYEHDPGVVPGLRGLGIGRVGRHGQPMGDRETSVEERFTPPLRPSIYYLLYTII
jgi:hypothetical protein